jgi:hypothetical protein
MFYLKIWIYLVQEYGFLSGSPSSDTGNQPAPGNEELHKPFRIRQLRRFGG